MNVQLNPLQRTRLDLIRTMPLPLDPIERHRFSIATASVGDYLTYASRTWKVMGSATLTEWAWNFGKRLRDTSTELSLQCLDTGEEVFLEWSQDDVVEVCVTTKKIRFQDLKDENNETIEASDLAQIADDEDEVFLRGVRYSYDDDDSWAAEYVRKGSGTGESEFLRAHEFSGADGTYLTIEEWYDDGPAGKTRSYHLWVSVPVSPRDITILAKAK